MTSRDLTTELPMYEDLPVDEVTAPSLVSTGELPTPEQVRDVVTEAYERFRHNDDGAVANYEPVVTRAARRNQTPPSRRSTRRAALHPGVSAKGHALLHPRAGSCAV